MGFSWIFQLAMFDETPRYRVGEGRSSGEDLQGNVWEAFFFWEIFDVRPLRDPKMGYYVYPLVIV